MDPWGATASGCSEENTMAAWIFARSPSSAGAAEVRAAKMTRGAVIS